jgi:D-alanyl-D-alanine dipeptidase
MIEINTTEHKNDELVRIAEYIPDINIELKYASADNFTGKAIYTFTDAYLRYGTVRKLTAVQKSLKNHGFGLKIWDAFRPVKAQFRLWEVCPNPTFVANPIKGYSSHSRGNTVDVTLVDLNENEIAMPTKFDEFTALTEQDNIKPEAENNAALLKSIMTENGFDADSDEWWHFSDTDNYPVEANFLLH